MDKPPKTPSPYLTRYEAEEYVRMSQVSFREFCKVWKVPATPIGQSSRRPQLLYKMSDLDAAMRQAALAAAKTSDIEDRAKAAARSL